MNRFPGRELTVAAALTGTLLSACSSHTSPEESGDTKSQPAATAAMLPSCYDTAVSTEPVFPQEPNPPAVPNYSKDITPEQLERDLDKWDRDFSAYEKAEANYEAALYGNDTPLHLPMDSMSGTVESDPVLLDDDIQTKVDDAIVEVSTPGWKGSGFLTTDRKGHEVVITAAHVAGPAKIEDLTVTDNDLKTSSVSGGCYIFQDNHKKVTPSPEGPGLDTDVAVLNLRTRIGSSTLAIAANNPKRGSWGFFSNYQNTNEPGNPAHYDGLVVKTPTIGDTSSSSDVLSGLRTFSTSQEAQQLADQERSLPGCSGGAFTNSKGAVIGISVAATNQDTYLSPDYLKTLYNLSFPNAVYGNKTGFLPDAATIMLPSVIQKALESPRE